VLHVPDPRPVRDSLIAATALVHGLVVVTRNVADFEPMGVEIIDPWQTAAELTRPVQAVLGPPNVPSATVGDKIRSLDLRAAQSGSPGGMKSRMARQPWERWRGGCIGATGRSRCARSRSQRD
jgi:hypothetical protein